MSRDLSKERKNRGGRPTIVFTDEQLKELEILSAICTLDEIADYFGIARETFRQIKIRDEEVSSLYKKRRIQAKGVMGSRLFKKGVIEGDVTAMIFYMKTQGGWKEAKEETEQEQVIIETPEEKAERLKERRIYMEFRSKYLKQVENDKKPNE